MSPVTILVADDWDEFRIALVGGLELFGYQAIGAADGTDFHEKASDLVERQVPFVLVVDNHMPEHSGDLEANFNQWCGLEHVLRLCKDHPHRQIGERVLFVSIRGLAALPTNLQAEAARLGLVDPSRWLDHFTPFPIFRSRLDTIINKSLAP